MHKKEIISMKPKLGLMLKEQREFLLLIFAWKKTLKISRVTRLKNDSSAFRHLIAAWG